MHAVSDKSSLFKLAESLRIPIPQTFHLARHTDLPQLIEQITNYPVVVKPALSKVLVGNGFMSGGVSYASNRRELELIYTKSPILCYPSIIQEKIKGIGTGLFTLYHKNKHLALFSHQRLREKPPSGGVSVVSESVPLDIDMVDSADRLLSTVGFNGIAMVEYKRDQRDGKAKLIEINGRFWGSLQLALACGVDFPNLYLDHLQGKVPSSSIKNYVVGHKLKWFFGTLDYLLIRLKNNNPSLNLPNYIPSKWFALFEFLNIWERNTSFDVANREDMNPFYYETIQYISSLWKKK
jgi:predicted ATP-grasp superfamily ATP-dependent carboligase